MIRINLLPLNQRQSKWPINKLLVGTVLLMGIIFGSLYSYSLFQIWNIEKELQVTRNQYQTMESTRILMTTANVKQQQFDKKNNIIINLTKERLSWYGIIEHLTMQTSPQIWFTDLIKSDKGGIQVKGWATTYPLVAEFMKTMENDSFFTDPILNSVEKESTTPATKFDIVIKPRGM